MQRNTILIKMLDDAVQVLDKHKIVYWLDCGTLLGAIRDNQLIAWDNDIDLGCWKIPADYEIKQRLRADFQSKGYEVLITDHWLNIHYKETPSLNMDINYYTVEGQMAVTPSSSLAPFLNDRVSKSANHIIKYLYGKEFIIKKFSPRFKLLLNAVLNAINQLFSLLPLRLKALVLDALIKIRKRASGHKAEMVPVKYFNRIINASVFEGKYSVPELASEYLEYRYGQDWRIPVKTWDTLAQDGTVK
jgi:hypothetical protein